jgi:DNA-binding response OmpR family regulator
LKTILVIEDEPDVRINLVELLESEGFNVLSAKNGQEGYATALSCEPDLILSDIRMPVLNGIELLKKLQNNFTTSMIPFIFLTAKTDIQDMRVGMTTGADDYILKPFQIDDVLEAIASRLKKSENYLAVIKEFRNTLMRRVPHELRTPLVGILGISGIMKDNVESLSKEELLQMAEIINKSGKRLHRRIEKFLTYMELLEQNKLDKPPKVHNRFRLNNEIVKNKLIDKAIEFNREFDITVNLDEAELGILESHYEIIIIELVENGLKFTAPGSPINITGEQSDKYYITKVKDIGQEITGVIIDEIRIFNQFDKEGLTEEGLGFGLSIVKNITDHSRGYLKFSRENKTSNIVEFGIPLAFSKT